MKESSQTEDCWKPSQSGMNSITHCILFMGIVIPSDTELLAEPEKFRLLLGTIAKALKPILTQHGGIMTKMVGEGFECYFLPTSDPTNTAAFKDVLECSFELDDLQKSLSLELKSEDFPDILCKVGVDYEKRILKPDLVLDKPPIWSASYEIFVKTPPNGIMVGEDLVKIIINSPELKNHYKFESVGEYPIEEKREDYKVYLLTRQKEK